jgi:CheY-like chemotaxis protein
MPLGGTLTIATRLIKIREDDLLTHPDVAVGDYIQLSVSDTGCGMTEEVRARAFEPFFTTKERGKGTGLGLATSHGIIRQAGGSIAVYSEPGVGTTFRIYLPVVAGVAIPKATPHAVPAQIGIETVLMVEDEPAVRRVGARLIRSLGYTVLEACDAMEALRILADPPQPIQLLFTDTVLPVMGGRELADRVKENYPEIKILFTSGYTDDVILQHKLASNDVLMVQKPYSKVTLAQKIRAALEAGVT